MQQLPERRRTPRAAPGSGSAQLDVARAYAAAVAPRCVAVAQSLSLHFLLHTASPTSDPPYPALPPTLTATLRVCADGGANRLYDELPSMLPGQAADEVRAAYLPSAIRGDLDSIRPDVLQFYKARGVQVEDLSGEQGRGGGGRLGDAWGWSASEQLRVVPTLGVASHPGRQVGPCCALAGTLATRG